MPAAFMEFWTGLVKQFRVAAAKPLAEAMRKFGLKAMQLTARDLIAEQPREQAKLEWDLPERLRSALAGPRLAPPPLAFSAPVRRELIPLRDQLGYERRLCSFRSSRRW